jgi:hypothetical protein
MKEWYSFRNRNEASLNTTADLTREHTHTHPSLASGMNHSRKVRKAVIPIAGWGTRMFPATKALPKALFPIVDTVSCLECQIQKTNCKNKTIQFFLKTNCDLMLNIYNVFFLFCLLFVLSYKGRFL